MSLAKVDWVHAASIPSFVIVMAAMMTNWASVLISHQDAPNSLTGHFSFKMFDFDTAKFVLVFFGSEPKTFEPARAFFICAVGIASLSLGWAVLFLGTKTGMMQLDAGFGSFSVTVAGILHTFIALTVATSFSLFVYGLNEIFDDPTRSEWIDWATDMETALTKGPGFWLMILSFIIENSVVFFIVRGSKDQVDPYNHHVKIPAGMVTSMSTIPTTQSGELNP